VTDRQTRRLTLRVATAHKPIQSDPKVYTTKQLQIVSYRWNNENTCKSFKEHIIL